MLEHRKG